MQLKFERDFFIRHALGSDLNEIAALAKESFDPTFFSREDLFFKVILNSNGVLIGVLLAETTKVVTIAINPNFLRKEVRDEVTRQLKEWASAHNGGKILIPRPLSRDDWKAYWKRAHLKVEVGPEGFEVLEFA
jgi:hypothetical protein